MLVLGKGKKMGVSLAADGVQGRAVPGSAIAPVLWTRAGGAALRIPHAKWVVADMLLETVK